MNDNTYTPLPLLPFGLTTRQHIGSYLASLRGFRDGVRELEDRSDTTAPRASAVLSLVADEIADICEFVDREARFYGVELPDLKSGRRSVRLSRDRCTEGHPTITYRFLRGEETEYTVTLHDNDSDILAHTVTALLTSE